MNRLSATVLILIVAALAAGLTLRLWPRSFDSALLELVDGDADAGERVACLRQLRDTGFARMRAGDRGAGVLAAMAAVALEDEAGYRQIVGFAAAATGSAWSPGAAGEALDAVGLDNASFGVAHLRSLLLGQRAARLGEPGAATHFAQAARAARLAGAPLAARLADEAR